MTENEWLSLVRTLKQNYRFADFIGTKEASDTWFNMLNQFRADDVKAGVTDYIMREHNAPTISDLVKATETAAKARRTKERLRSQDAGKTANCALCADRGYTVKIYPNLTEYVRPCSCDKGREMFPSFFWSRAEERDWISEENVKGRSPAPRIKPDAEWSRKYLSNTDVSQEYLDFLGQVSWGREVAK